MNVYQKGLFYEWRAAWVARRHGMRIIKRRFRARGGEIDLIADDHGTLVFIEVKARPKKEKGSGASAVGYDKIRRVHQAAEAFMQKQHRMDDFCRFDIIEFTRDGCSYLKDAF